MTTSPVGHGAPDTSKSGSVRGRRSQRWEEGGEEDLVGVTDDDTCGVGSLGCVGGTYTRVSRTRTRCPGLGGDVHTD